MRLALIFVCFFIAVQLGSACLELRLARPVYLPKETAQVEVDAEIVGVLTKDDIAFYRNETKMPIDIFISRISSTKYFLWFDLPAEPGFYTLKVRERCKDGNLYSIEKEIEIKQPLSYEKLLKEIKGKWQQFSLETHCLAAFALAYNSSAQAEALKAYLKRPDSCLKRECSTKEIALSALAFNSLRKDLFEKLKAYQNSLVGKWKLQLNSVESQNCSLTIDNKTSPIELVSGTNEIELNLTDSDSETIKIEINCSNISGNLSYQHAGLSKNFSLTPAIPVIEINNQGCWGSELKSKCDESSTLYALLSLYLSQELKNETKALEWLKANAKLTASEAFLYKLTKDQELIEKLIESQTSEGYWIEAGKPSLEGTGLARFALKTEPSAEAVKAVKAAGSWLLKQTKIEDQAFVFGIAFSASEIEPILSIWPGMIKTKSQSYFNLFLSNKGSFDLKINATLLNSSAEIELPSFSEKVVKFKVPKVTTPEGKAILEHQILSYHQVLSESCWSYSIPVLLFTEVGPAQLGPFNFTEVEVNESEKSALKNETMKESQEITAELNESLITKTFFFKPTNLTVKVNATTTLTVELVNRFGKPLTGLELSRSLSFVDLVEIENVPSQLEPGVTKITLKINPEAVAKGFYKGYIKATAYYEGTQIETNLSVELNVTKTLLSCAELGGKLCEKEKGFECENPLEEAADTLSCCIPAEACKTKKHIFPALIIVLAFITVLLVIYLLLKRKPRREMKALLEKQAKEYERRFQRPSPLMKL